MKRTSSWKLLLSNSQKRLNVEYGNLTPRVFNGIALNRRKALNSFVEAHVKQTKGFTIIISAL